MELKIDVAKVPFVVESNGENVVRVCGVYLYLDPRKGNVTPGRSTGTYWCRNVSTADVEMIQFACGVGVGDDVPGVKVKSRYVRKFVELSNPEWRG